MALSRIDLRPDLAEIVKQILAEHVPECEVRAFGSRATWTAREYSDLDLVVVGNGPLDRRTMGRLREAFEESRLPMRVDVLDWHSIPDQFRAEINQDFVVVQKPLHPARFKTYRLEDVIDVNPRRSLLKGRDTTFIPMSAVPEGSRSIGVKETRTYRGGGARFENGDTLLARITPSLENGKTAWISDLKDGEAAFGSTEFIVLAARKGSSEPLFVYYLARSPGFRAYAIGQMTGTSGRQRVPTIAIKNYYLSLPPLDDQRYIAKVLGVLDDKIELNRRMCRTLEEMAQALFKSWFVDFDPVRAKMEGRWRPGESLPGLPAHLYDLFPDCLVDSELGPIPKGWRIGPLSKYFDLTMGQSPPGSTYNDAGKGLPFYQGRAGFGFRFPESKRFCTAPTRIAESGDTLVTVRAPVGAINMAWEKCCVGRGVSVLRHKSGSSAYT